MKHRSSLAVIDNGKAMSLVMSLFAILLHFSSAYGAVLLNNAMVNTPGGGHNISAPTSNSLTSCVDTSSHQDWQGTLDAPGCRDSYQLIRSRVQENLHSAYNFYSIQAFPRGGERPPNGWPLPQGSNSGEVQFFPSQIVYPPE